MTSADLFAMIKPARPMPLWTTSPQYQTYLDAPNWVAEPKYDGYRVLLCYGSDGPVAYSRKGKRLAVPGYLAPDCPEGTVLDGEWMRHSFPGSVWFDVPVINVSYNTEPLSVRRRQLREMVPALGPSRSVTRLQKVPSLALEAVKGTLIEGIVLKDINQPYPRGETPHWLKVKA
jgi:ATP-dependent DNA ligase